MTDPITVTCYRCTTTFTVGDPARKGVEHCRCSAPGCGKPFWTASREYSDGRNYIHMGVTLKALSEVWRRDEATA